MTKNQLKEKGYLKVASLIDIDSLKSLNYKIINELNNPSSLMKAINYKKKNNSKLIEKLVSQKKPLINQKKLFLTKKDYKKGYNYYSKLTNSVQIKNPLIKFHELNKFIFSDKIYSSLKKYFKDDNFYFLYGALRLHFKNNLPNMDSNYFHIDKTYNMREKTKQIIKFSIPFTLKNNKKVNCSEFNLISLNIKKLSNDEIYKTDYSLKKNLSLNLKHKLKNPKIKSGDCLFFDPINFFHNADKPKHLRVVFYGVVGRKKNYISKKTKYLKISNKIAKNFNKRINKFTCLLKKV